MIYTALNWWVPCTGDSTAFSQTNPLWIADHVNDPPAMFGGWGFRTFRQCTVDGVIVARLDPVGSAVTWSEDGDHAGRTEEIDGGEV